jgi:hypothetical protein
MKIALIFIAVMLTFDSCTTQLKVVHRRELRTELSKYVDALDLRRTEIILYGFGYTRIGSALPYIGLYLYLRPDHNNHEAIITIRDELITFLRNNDWEARGAITIDFRSKESRETKSIYYVQYDEYECEWNEWWVDELPENRKVFIKRKQ